MIKTFCYLYAKRNIRLYAILLTLILSPVSLYSQVIDKDSVWIHMPNGVIKAYSRKHLEKLHANEENQFLTFSFPSGEYTIYEGENELTEDTLEVSNEGDTRQYQCRADAIVSIPENDWCSAMNNNGTLIVKILPNMTTEQRTIDIKVNSTRYLLIIHVIQAFRIDSLSDIIPEEVLELFDSSIIPFNPGNTPPNIEGTYFMDPMILTYSSQEKDNWIFGKQNEGQILFLSEYIRFSEQNTTNSIICEKLTSDGCAYSVSNECKITGSGDLFTIFHKSTTTDDKYKAKAISTDIISGRWTPSGIEDISSAFVMVEKDDPNNNYVSVGTCRKFVDADNISFNATWPRSSALTPPYKDKKVKSDSQSVNAMAIVLRGVEDNLILELNNAPELKVKDDKTFDVILGDIILQNITAEQLNYIQYLHDESIATNITDPKSEEAFKIHIKIENENICFPNLSKDTNMALYYSDGTICQIDTQRKGSQVLFNISHLSPGTYILQINKQSIKFVKR